MKKNVFMLNLLATNALATNVWADVCPEGVCSAGYYCQCEGNLVVEKWNNGGRRSITTYDADGHKTSATTYENGVATKQYRYTYEGGYMTSETIYEGTSNIASETPTPSYQWRYTRDEAGRETSMTKYTGAQLNVLTSTSITTYDEAGRRTSVTSYNGDTPSWQYRYIYDDQNRVIAQLQYGNASSIESGEHTSGSYYAYDNDGNRTTITGTQEIKLTCGSSYCTTTYTDNSSSFNLTSLPTLDCHIGYKTGCVGYNQSNINFDYTVVPEIICAIGHIEGCIENVTTNTNNDEGTEETQNNENENNTENSTNDNSSVDTGTSVINDQNDSNNNEQPTYTPKRIYTVEEARQAVEAAGTDTVNFRIRYK